MEALTQDAATDNPFYDYDSRANRYRDLSSGRFLKKEVIDRLTQQRIDYAKQDLGIIGQLLFDGKISLETWQTQTREALKILHAQQYMLGVGGKANLEKSDYLEIGRHLKSEYEYLQGFAQDLTMGAITRKEAESRLQLYAKSSMVSFHKGERTAYKRSGKPSAKRVLGLNDNHCLQCPQYAARGIVPIDEVILPGVACDCGGNCQCKVVYGTSQELSLIAS